MALWRRASIVSQATLALTTLRNERFTSYAEPVSERNWHLAQVNIGIPRGPMDSATMAGFAAMLEPVNALADDAPGFVWRLQDEGGDATSISVFDDPGLIVNMSVWKSIEPLWEFVYDGRHLEVMRRRREWFTRMAEQFMCLWWLPAGELPTVADAEERLERLRADGPTLRAFTFKQRFAAPSSTDPSSTESGSRSGPSRSPSRNG
jgi:Domain of unknown function (DUF3291)